jgi:hypothetical protein
MVDNYGKGWLERLGRQVRAELKARVAPDIVALEPLSTLRGVATNSDGWVLTLGSVRRDRGSELQLWLDRWTDGQHRRLAYGYRSPSSERVIAMAEAGTGSLGTATRYRNDFVLRKDGSGFSMMEHPLKPGLFGKPVVEANDDRYGVSYLAVYELRTPSFATLPSAAMTRRVAGFLREVVLTASALSAPVDADTPFPQERNRKKVALHTRRERNPKLARLVKSRDGHTCRVCDLNFENVYGAIGRGFAEAHHVLQLSKVKEGTVINAKDLITVCANCHRMLHRMDGAAGNWSTLRKVVRARR